MRDDFDLHASGALHTGSSGPDHSHSTLIGESPAWLEMLEHISLVAPIERPLLVIGERGTGKELIGERIHFLSKRWRGPFIRVNCAALSEELLDSELFGHERGAFTGAVSGREGRFEQADGGTLFLDEIATASQRVQEKLLRVIEYGQFYRLGGEQLQSCDVRVIGATNINLSALVKQGKFRADLLDRLAFDVVVTPPLRVRQPDIALLANRFAYAMEQEMEGEFPGFSASAMERLERHSWPGNVRELKNTVQRISARAIAHNLSEPIMLEADDLNPFNMPHIPDLDGVAGREEANETDTPQPAAFASLRESPPPQSVGTIDFEAEVKAYELRMIEEAMQYADGHQGKAAASLKLTYHQFRGLLRKHEYFARKARL